MSECPPTLPFERITAGDEILYVLPYRDPTGLRTLGVLGMLFGLTLAAIGVYGTLYWGDLLGPILAIVALAFARRGAFLLFPAVCLVRITATHLIVTEKMLFLRITKRMKRQRIRALTVSAPSPELIQQSGLLSLASAGIRMHLGNGKSKYVAGAYPLELLEPLAHDIAAALAQTPPTHAPFDARLPAAPPPVQVEFVMPGEGS
jgi:hypothetical protein